MEIPRRYWGIGLAAAIGAHFLLGVAMFWQPAQSGARSTGMGGVEISLGPGGGAPGTVASETGEVAETEAVPPEAVTETSRPAESKTTQPDTVQTRRVEPVAGASTIAVEHAEPVETNQGTETTRQPREPVEETRETPQAIEPPEAVEPGPRQTPEETETGEARVARAPSVAGSEGRAGTGSGNDAGSGGGASTGGGVPGASADYMAELRAWLEKHKQYPRRARRLRQEGTALLYFVMDSEGRVLEYRIRESSGHESLDEAVTTMIERAQPLPGFPEGMDQGRLALVVPVQFLLM